MSDGGAEPVRTFFALALPPAVGLELDRAVDTMRREAWAKPVRWVRGGNRHVTIRFLGGVERDELPGIVRSVEGAIDGLAGFEVQLERIALFPSPRRPRAITVSLTAERGLKALARAVESGVVARGMAPENRPFRPHITLGRIRGRLASEPDVERVLEPRAMAVRELTLFRSVLRPSGARYTPLARFELATR